LLGVNCQAACWLGLAPRKALGDFSGNLTPHFSKAKKKRSRKTGKLG
jgi:hypothetical protein